MALRTYSNEDYQVAKLAAQALGVELSQEVYLDEKTARSYELLKVGTYYWASIAHECSAFYEVLGYEKPIPLTAYQLAEVLGTTASFQTWHDHEDKAYETLMVGPFPWADIAGVFGKEYLDEDAVNGKCNTLSVEARQALVGPVGVCKQLELLERLQSYGLDAQNNGPSVLSSMLFEVVGCHYGAFIQKCLVCQAVHPLDDITCESLGSCPYESLSFASFLRSLRENAADFGFLEGDAADFDSLKNNASDVRSFEDNSADTSFLKDNNVNFDSLEENTGNTYSFKPKTTESCPLKDNSVVFAWKKHTNVTPILQTPHLPVKRAIHHARDNPPKGGDATPPNA